MNCILLFLGILFAQTDPSPSAESSTEISTKKSNRMKMLSGSPSKWSAQANFYYNGPDLAHPLEGKAPNPGKLVPPPLVKLNGYFTIRPRLDPDTTVGIGTGIYVQSPFQNPQGFSIADPYVDYLHVYTLFHTINRFNPYFGPWTNTQFSAEYGYRWGVGFSNETTITFLTYFTLGTNIQCDLNLFDHSKQYKKEEQTRYDIIIEPYIEYAFNDIVNLRGTIRRTWINTRHYSDYITMFSPETSSNLGVGIALTNSIFLNPYIQFYPFSKNISLTNCLYGVTLLTNLF